MDRHIQIGGRTYHYSDTGPSSSLPLVCIHGFPDSFRSFHALHALPYRIVSVSPLGYATSSLARLEYITYKRFSDDMAAWISKEWKSVVLIGHDWGGMLATRLALWHPEVVSRLVTICVPFTPPQRTPYLPIHDLIRQLPNFQYQALFFEKDLEHEIDGKPWNVRRFLNIVLRAPEDGIRFNLTRDLLQRAGNPAQTTLLSLQEFEELVRDFSQPGKIHGIFNYYRTRHLNYFDELGLENTTIDVPYLFIGATKDTALPPSMSAGMERYCSRLTRKEINTGHWVMYESPKEARLMIQNWLARSNL